MPYFAPIPPGTTSQAVALQDVRPASTQDIDYTSLPAWERIVQAIDPKGRVEVDANRQTFNEQTQVFTATGNVVMRYRGAVLEADEIEVNLITRKATATGEEVVLTRGEQVLRGKRLDYDLDAESGVFYQVRGGVRLQEADRDTNLIDAPILVDPGAPPRVVLPQTAVERPGRGLQRFTADELTFDSKGGGTATNLRITNDPFDPPELELQSRKAILTRLPNGDSEIRAQGGQLAFDRRIAVPLLRDRVVISRRRRDPLPVELGYDQRDLGGVFLSRTFDVVDERNITFQITPILLLQRTIEQGFDPVGNNFALGSRLVADVARDTTLRMDALLSRLDFLDTDQRLRARLRLEHRWFRENSVVADTVYRQRVFNGSLGFENVQFATGVSLLSTEPIKLNKTGTTQLQYVLGGRYIESNGITPQNQVGLLRLGRFQLAGLLTHSITLWQGKALPPTATQGLRFSPVPITPYLNFNVGLSSTNNLYTNGDSQIVLGGYVGFSGQFGNFAKNFFDYTAVNVVYAPGFVLTGLSPFFFDRRVDQQVMFFSIKQQLFGPLRATASIVLSLDNGGAQIVDATYGLEYSRRTYGVSVFFNPERAQGGVLFRLNEFNWTGNPEPLLEREQITPSLDVQ
ncbi:DUF3769 domain-containing protein [Synechococcus sp. C9]|uniref:DUF3769 domain-containing protein n=1 Tax=Synechococcus sp. C9 TaxID=102119 RepID=UPI001FF6DD99|nr:DUF3769 domain-containing protein [Synechococcus sp. C9]